MGLGLNEGVATAVKLAEMYDPQDVRTFDERRAEVVEIIRSATDFAGVDQGLHAIFEVMVTAHDEQTFDEALHNLALSLAENTSALSADGLTRDLTSAPGTVPAAPETVPERGLLEIPGARDDRSDSAASDRTGPCHNGTVAHDEDAEADDGVQADEGDATDAPPEAATDSGGFDRWRKESALGGSAPALPVGCRPSSRRRSTRW